MEIIRERQKIQVDEAFYAALSADDQGSVLKLFKKYGHSLTPFVELTLRNLFFFKKYQKIEVLSATCIGHDIKSITVIAYNVIAQQQLKLNGGIQGKDYPWVIRALEEEVEYFEEIEKSFCAKVIQSTLKQLKMESEAKNELRRIFFENTPNELSKSHAELPPYASGRILSPKPIKAAAPSLGPQPLQRYLKELRQGK